MLSERERSAIGRLGALTMHSRNDSRITSAPGRAAFNTRWALEVDPDGILPEAERARRAELARRAYFTRLALMSAKARRKGAAT